MRDKQKAFTLIELLVVIGIIATLATMLLPALGQALRETKRTACAGSLKGLGQAAHTYAGDYEARFPACTDSSNTEVSNVGYFAFSRTKNPHHSHSRAWFQLVKLNFSAAESFSCAEDKNVDVGSGIVSDLYDFPTTSKGNPMSYSMQRSLYKDNDPPPVWAFTQSTPANMILMSDMNGLMDWANNGVASGDTQVTWKGQRNSVSLGDGGSHINSANHRRDGQNVLAVGGSCRWSNTALCAGGNDNIYTPHIGTPGVGANPIGAEEPHNQTDSFLMP
jgi:prepilin-type N-terminal cleavage/methylation domain-containing protein